MNPKDVVTQYYKIMNEAFASKSLATDKLPLADDISMSVLLRHPLVLCQRLNGWK